MKDQKTLKKFEEFIDETIAGLEKEIVVEF
jgi:hypothetical protein